VDPAGSKRVAEAAGTADVTGIRVPPPVYYVAGFLAGLALELAFPVDWPPDWIRWVGAAVAGGAWLALDGLAMVSFQRAGTSMVPMKPASALVTSGPYRFTRNPMYVGMACLYAAFALGFGVVWALALLPVVLLIVDRVVIAREEPYLERKFGQPYRDYKSRVRRWI
jgi:protein-S-isoprenylcysteine O-methyltransferase Ste14